MKISLIKPTIGRREHSLYVDEGRMEPLMLDVLAGLTPPDVEVVLHDDRMEAIPYDEPTDLAAITVETFTARRAYEIAAEYRRRGVPVVLGGIHVTLLPEEAAAHADSILTGDAECAWPRLVEDARRRRLLPRYDGHPGIAQTLGGENVLPRREIFAGKGYLPIALLQFSRGCRFGCRFCAISRYFDRQHYQRRIEHVVAEIERQERRFLFFVDDNIASDHAALKALCRALIPLDIHWISQASLDATHDRELMRLMERSGCWGNVMGFESITAASLRDAAKSPNLPGFADYREEIAILREHGMQTWAAFTLGYDHDTPESIRATTDFALRHRFTFAAYNILMPYPGTPFYRQLAGQNRLRYGGRWWLHPEYRFNHAAFEPARMTAEELTDACHAARVRYNRPGALLRRFSDWQTNWRTLSRALAFWRYTLLFRREVYKKHGMRFGLK
ncbi:MAG: B12-binding domain-containing radical SAM protein [Zoogloeaceae bacterium]|jgi:radical SAM superfamily enzyme YgiQ (UPF0313 family)|nr:B12-binding domain-containing radical SAM protein [Zoogloeaceae bacterium]